MLFIVALTFDQGALQELHPPLKHLTDYELSTELSSLAKNNFQFKGTISCGTLSGVLYIVALTFNQGTLIYKNSPNALSDLHSGVHKQLQGT